MVMVSYNIPDILPILSMNTWWFEYITLSVI